MQISVDKLKNMTLAIGTPMYGGTVTGNYTRSMATLHQLCGQYGLNLKTMSWHNESLIPRARNYIVDMFLRSDATHLLFIDADIEFSAVDALALWYIQVTNPDKYDILAGLYPKKAIRWDQVLEAAKSGVCDLDPSKLALYGADFVFNPIGGQTTFNVGEPVKVLEAGTGFMLIPREIFERFATTYPETLYTPDHIHMDHVDGSRKINAFFDCGIDPHSNRYLSEDYYFCQKAAAAGINTHICPWMRLDHIGSYVYKGSIPDIAMKSK